MDKKKAAEPQKTKAQRPEGAGSRGPVPGEGGAPKKIPTEEELEQLTRLASIGGTHWEMAFLLGVDENTLRARIKDSPKVAKAIEKGLYEGNVSLRRKVMKLALDDNHSAQATMLIWACKTRLGQSDRVAVKIENEADAMEHLQRLFPDLNLQKPQGTAA